MHESPLPSGTIDTHFHVFGPVCDFPYAADRTYTPADATIDEYISLARRLGFSRSVIVQPSVYGTDNSRTLSSLEEQAVPMRGIVVVDETVTQDELGRMHDLGVRGVRINLVFGGGAALETARRLAPRIREFDWHIQFLVDVSTIEELRQCIETLDITTVFDHFGHIPAGSVAANPGFEALLGLLRDGHSWVKLSGAYRITNERTAPYGDITPLARDLIAANPDRVVWATDWPHPAIRVPFPDDTVLARMALEWAPDPATRHKLFVANAERLYGFEPLPANASQ